MAEQSLTVIQQKTVVFYGDTIRAIRVKDGSVYVPIRPICELLGVSWSSQQNRINRDAVLSEMVANISVFVTNTEGKGQHRTMLCLPLDFVGGFLFGINANRVKDTIREKLLRYQKECYRVLSEAFFEGRLTAEPSLEALLQDTDNPTVQAYKTFQALTKLARSQLILESRVDEHEQRLEQIEAILGDSGSMITPDQAMQVSQAVKTIAIVLGKQTKRNEFGAVYGELYRKFGITSYKQLPKHHFQECMDWLTEWHQNLTDDAGF